MASVGETTQSPGPTREPGLRVLWVSTLSWVVTMETKRGLGWAQLPVIPVSAVQSLPLHDAALPPARRLISRFYP